MSKVIRCDADGCRQAIPLEEAGPSAYTLPDVPDEWVSLNPPGLIDGGPDFCSLECAATGIRGAVVKKAISPVKGVA